MFKARSHTKELLDNEAIPVNDLHQNLDELHFINKTLGGYRISLGALKKVGVSGKTIVDIGCGGGHMLHEIHAWGQKNNQPMQLIGIDLKKDCIGYAVKQGFPGKGIVFIQDDYRAVSGHVKKVDILHACLFTHHLGDAEIVALIRFARSVQATLVINDLERNPIAYYAIKTLTALFSKSYLVKNDAPLSVLRGFKKREWRARLNEAGATRFLLTWKWAFRHQVIVYAD